MDPCHDVLVLHHELAKNSVSMEEIFDASATASVSFGGCLLDCEYCVATTGCELGALLGVLDPNFRNGQSFRSLYGFLPKSILQEATETKLCQRLGDSSDSQ